MIQVRKAEERGHFNHGWLNTYHTFSFADYYDPAHMGFRHLRVINQDRVQPGRGFPRHSHGDMEILSYVLEGALQHSDSMGDGSVILPGEVQRMSAGTGVTHSEYNPSLTEVVHFLQIWILPSQNGLEPSYEQRAYTEEERRGKLCLVASPDGRDGSVTLHQDANVYVTLLDSQEELLHRIPPGRHSWAQVARGRVLLHSFLLKEGDGAAISEEESLRLVGKERAEVLLFDLA